MLRAAGTLKDWPPQFIDAFRRAECEAITIDCVREAEFAKVLAVLASAGVRALSLKGAALGHTHYPASHVRPHADSDLLVPGSDVAPLENALVRLGYARPPEISGRLVSYQSHYYKTDRHGVVHALDVHWKISNLQALADCLTFEELWRSRIPIQALGRAAVTVSDVHALLLALVHRAGHHPGSRHLLWIYDVHLLGNRLTLDGMRQVQELSAARGLSGIVCEGLTLAYEWFGTPAADRLVDALHDRTAHEESTAVIHGAWRQADVLRLDLEALPNWRARRRLLREHLLPSPKYMRARYGVRSNLVLPGLYVWRVLRGAPKWLRSRETDE
jgi:hypothetical protein